MRLYWLSARVWLVNVTSSLAQLALDAWRGPVPPEVIAQHPAGGRPAPIVPSQRDVSGLCIVSEDEIGAMSRFKAARDLGEEPDPADVELVQAVQKRAELALLEALWKAPCAAVKR